MNEKIWLVLATVCVCVTGGTEDHNCFNTDPRFRGASAGNYRIKAVAPCFNAGVFQADWMQGAVYLDGNPRILFSQVDIGCYECPSGGGMAIIVR